MPVGLLMAMDPSAPTSHGLTVKAANVTSLSTGARMAGFVVVRDLGCSDWTSVFALTRDGTETVLRRGVSS